MCRIFTVYVLTFGLQIDKTYLMYLIRRVNLQSNTLIFVFPVYKDITKLFRSDSQIKSTVFVMVFQGIRYRTRDQRSRSVRLLIYNNKNDGVSLKRKEISSLNEFVRVRLPLTVDVLVQTDSQSVGLSRRLTCRLQTQSIISVTGLNRSLCV